jgi:hypothetical protein
MSDYIMPVELRNRLIEFLTSEVMHGRAPLCIATPIWNALLTLQPLIDTQSPDANHSGTSVAE